MNARTTLSTAALATLFALGAPAFGAAGDAQKQDTRDSLTHLANYVPPQLDDERYSAVGGDRARAPEKNPSAVSRLNHFQRFIQWTAALRI
jgi:hypothetical protein